MYRTSSSLVVGADSMLGATLVAMLQTTAGRVLATSRQGRPGTIELDLANSPSSWHIPSGVEVAFVCAGITSVAQCRAMPDLAWAVNVLGTLELARRLVDQGAFVVFPSSNRVFDGSRAFQAADAAKCPMTEYGHTKAAAEDRLLRLGGRVAVVRVTKIIGPATPLFVRWRECLQSETAIHPYADMVMSPVAATYVADTFTRLASLQLAGVSQLSGEKDVTFEQVGRRLCGFMNAHQSLVRPYSWRKHPECIDHVPEHTTLDASRVTSITGIKPPDLDSTLDAVLRTL